MAFISLNPGPAGGLVVLLIFLFRLGVCWARRAPLGRRRSDTSNMWSVWRCINTEHHEMLGIECFWWSRGAHHSPPPPPHTHSPVPIQPCTTPRGTDSSHSRIGTRTAVFVLIHLPTLCFYFSYSLYHYAVVLFCLFYISHALATCIGIILAKAE